ncbi:MAG: hypothetical protein R6T89_05605, partial [Candidatus Syntrophosphaera sp.]
EKMARYGLSVQQVQRYIEVAIGGMNLTTTVEGRERYPAARFDQTSYEILVSKAMTVTHGLFMELLENSGLKNVKIIDGYRYEMMKFSDFVVSTSGTATLETAFIGTPLVICYKASPISYRIGRRLIRVKRIGLPNIILDQDLLPELIQSELTPSNIEKTVRQMLNDPQKMSAVRTELSRLRALLSDKKPSREIPRIVREILGIDG